MKFLLVFVLAAVGLFASALAADCEIGGHQFNAGEKYTPIGECIVYTCQGPKAFTALTCPAEVSKCEPTPVDLTKPYPSCCPQHTNDC